MSQAFEKPKRYLGNRQSETNGRKEDKKRRTYSYIGSQIATYKVNSLWAHWFQEIVLFPGKKYKHQQSIKNDFTHTKLNKKEIKNLTRLLAGLMVWLHLHFTQSVVNQLRQPPSHCNFKFAPPTASAACNCRASTNSTRLLCLACSSLQFSCSCCLDHGLETPPLLPPPLRPH